MKKILALILAVITICNTCFGNILYKTKGNKYLCFGDNGGQLYGWQLVDDKWYCFDPDDGTMLTKQWTEDGYYVNENGEWVPERGCARDYSTEGFKFTTSKDKFTFIFADGTKPYGTWVQLSPYKDDVYYYYYFDYNGELVTNKSDVQGKYAVDAEGRWIDSKSKTVHSEYILDSQAKTYSSFEDSTGTNQSAVLYQAGRVLYDEARDQTIIYAATNTKSKRFVTAINTAVASNCDFDVEDRNYYDVYAEDKKGILKKCIRMNGAKSSFTINTKQYNYYKLVYAMEYNGQEPGAQEDDWMKLDVYVDGIEYDMDDTIYEIGSDGNTTHTMEIQVNKGQQILVVYEASKSMFDLIINADVKRMKDEVDDEDND